MTAMGLGLRLLTKTAVDVPSYSEIILASDSASRGRVSSCL
jgi:hypothetical protein